MRKKLILVCLLTVLALALLASCQDNPINDKTPKLDTPSNVRFFGNILKWDAVENADRYLVTIFTNTSSYTITQTELQYEVPITSAGDYTATVKARRSDGTYKDSESSTPIVYHMGTGSIDDPVIIYSKTELSKIGIGAIISTGSNPTTTPLYFVLNADIDLDGAEWTPIGSGPDNRFQGHFDGQGYTISNFKITVANGSYHGLFKGVLNGSIKNLNVSDYIININQNGTYRIGGLAGYVTNSDIINCTANGSVNFVAPSWNASSNTDTRTQYVGGLVGYFEKTSASSVVPEIGYCSTSGSVRGEGYTAYVGGLVGYNYGAKIQYSYSLSNVTAKGRTLYAGGLAGSSLYSNALVSNCYSIGSVLGEYTLTLNAGSFIGYIYNNSNVINSYSTGAVSGTVIPVQGISSTTNRSGFIGYITGTVVVSGLYYDYETMGLGIDKDAGNSPFNRNNIFAKTSEQMKDVATYVDWDFEGVWIIDPDNNDGYPTLRAYVPPIEEEEEEEQE